MLDDLEKETISPVFEIRAEMIDDASSRLDVRNEFLVCSFVSRSNARCPFELSLGRGPEIGRVSLFIGLGAEFYNYESFHDPESRAEIREDLDRFLGSVVHCESVIGRKGTAVEHYTPSKLFIGESPLRLTFRRYYLWPFSEKTTNVIDYQPWIE